VAAGIFIDTPKFPLFTSLWLVEVFTVIWWLTAKVNIQI
jgi:hypothetical protein